MRKLLKSFSRQLKRISFRFINLFSVPSVWMLIILLVLSSLSLFYSIKLENNNQHYFSSMLLNLFAGIITGLTITMVAGSKQLYLIRLNSKYDWLNDTHKMILVFFKHYRSLCSSQNNAKEDVFDLAYDVVSSAHHVNERVSQSQFDKLLWFDPESYFNKKYCYNSYEMITAFSDVRDFILINELEQNSRMLYIEELRKIELIMFKLNTKILDDMREIKARLNSAQRSII